MNRHLIGLLCGIFLVTAMYSVELSSIRVSDYIYDGELETHYNIHNTGQENLDDVKVTIWIPEIDYYATTGAFDIDDGDHYGHYFTPDVSMIEPGEYFARIMAQNDYAKDIKWRWIVIE